MAGTQYQKYANLKIFEKYMYILSDLHSEKRNLIKRKALNWIPGTKMTDLISFHCVQPPLAPAVGIALLLKFDIRIIYQDTSEKST